MPLSVRWASTAPHTSIDDTVQPSGTLQYPASLLGRSSTSTGIVAVDGALASLEAGCDAPRLVSHSPPPVTRATGASGPAAGGAKSGARSMSSDHDAVPVAGGSAAVTTTASSTVSIGTVSTNVVGAPFSSAYGRSTDRSGSASATTPSAP